MFATISQICHLGVHVPGGGTGGAGPSGPGPGPVCVAKSRAPTVRPRPIVSFESRTRSGLIFGKSLLNTNPILLNYSADLENFAGSHRIGVSPPGIKLVP